MTTRKKKIEKEKYPLPELRVRDPMSVVIEKLGDRPARVSGDMSKETLKELLMSSLMLVPKDPSIISESFRDMLIPRRARRSLPSEKKSRRKSKKTKIRKSIKDRSDVISDEDSRWDLYDEATIDEEMKGTEEEEEKEKEEKDIPSCPSSLTEDLDLSYDGKWLRKYMKIPLRMAFKEIVAKKPYDPVGYLGFWLLNYKKTLEDNRRFLELEEELYHLRHLMIKSKEMEEIPELRTDEEEENIEVDWNFQRYNNNW
ncbi:DPY30 domain-containing protein 1-like [Vespula squamosa]|uniref:DPY30 domain-containing protein 1-like n=1 Tax=Vespula squamosa TaxID=30214 RepID=A0ABD2C708_VESSQ